MPGLNHRGPMGQGPGTGRGLGKCRPNNVNDEQTSKAVPEEHVDHSSRENQGWSGQGGYFRNGNGMGKGRRNASGGKGRRRNQN